MTTHHTPPARSLTLFIIALALSACAAHTPKPLCHGPLIPINKAPINKMPINAATPPSET